MLAQRGARHPEAVRITAGKDLADLHATGGTAAAPRRWPRARAGGLVYAEAHLAAHPPADTAEARVATARAAAAHAGGLTLGQRADLGGLLIGKAGIGRCRPGHRHPGGGTAPKPAAAAALAHAGPAAARPARRR